MPIFIVALALLSLPSLTHAAIEQEQQFVNTNGEANYRYDVTGGESVTLTHVDFITYQANPAIVGVVCDGLNLIPASGVANEVSWSGQHQCSSIDINLGDWSVQNFGFASIRYFIGSGTVSTSTDIEVTPTMTSGEILIATMIFLYIVLDLTVFVFASLRIVKLWEKRTKP